MTIVDEIQHPRTKGGATTVLVLEALRVVERRIHLIEKRHIQHEATGDTVRMPVTVRRQKALVQRPSATPCEIPKTNEEQD